MKQSRLIFVKRIVSLAVAITVVLCLSACGRVRKKYEVINDIYNLEGQKMAYGNAYEWCTLDTDDGFSKTQGENNFYYMYTGYTDITFQITDKQIKQCTYSEKHNGWIASFDNRNIVTFKNSADRNKNAEGIDMSFGSDGNNITPVIGFKAPQNGIYTFKILNADIGNKSVNGNNSDGVNLFICTGESKIMTEVFFNKRVNDYNTSIKLALRQNQFIYMLVDPRYYEHYDVAESVVLQVELEGDYRQFCPDNSTTWGFGDVYYLGANAEQGANGWYYLYGAKNENGVYETGELEQCDVVKNGNNYYFGGKKNTKVDYTNGHLTAGEDTAVATALKIPRKGYYAFDIYFDKDSIGNFSVYCGDRRVRVPSFEEETDGHMYFEAVMDEEEMFYYILSEGESDVNIAVRQIKNPLGTDD